MPINIFLVEGEIFAWGKGDEGQLGIGETPSFVCTPVQLSLQELKTKYDFQNFEDISCGEKHTVALSGMLININYFRNKIIYIINYLKSMVYVSLGGVQSMVSWGTEKKKTR